MLFKHCGRTDWQTDDDNDGRWVITIAHLEPSAQVSSKCRSRSVLRSQLSGSTLFAMAGNYEYSGSAEQGLNMKFWSICPWWKLFRRTELMACHVSVVFALLRWRVPKLSFFEHKISLVLSVCVEVLQPSQPNGVMSSTVSLPNHMFTGQA